MNNRAPRIVEVLDYDFEGYSSYVTLVLNGQDLPSDEIMHYVDGPEDTHAYCGQSMVDDEYVDVDVEVTVPVCANCHLISRDIS